MPLNCSTDRSDSFLIVAIGLMLVSILGFCLFIRTHTHTCYRGCCTAMTSYPQISSWNRTHWLCTLLNIITVLSSQHFSHLFFSSFHHQHHHQLHFYFFVTFLFRFKVLLIDTLLYLLLFRFRLLPLSERQKFYFYKIKKKN